MTKPSKKLPKFKSIQEEAGFWDTNDVGDYLNELRVIDAKYEPTDEVKTTMTIRVTPTLKMMVEKMAKKYETSASSLVRMWMIDRLDSSSRF